MSSLPTNYKGLGNPSNAVVVTPSNSTEFGESSLYVGVMGDVTVDMSGTGTNVTFSNVLGFIPCSVTRVYLTGTDATNIVRIY